MNNFFEGAKRYNLTTVIAEAKRIEETTGRKCIYDQFGEFDHVNQRCAPFFLFALWPNEILRIQAEDGDFYPCVSGKLIRAEVTE